ncbi:hypothetical protein BC832DRAFT_537418 [Gaertneriomyces semiglobifer]|nr:hypothetical protein BC832DRAFT_537418 [Gaertneriomyces semiglobifer]
MACGRVRDMDERGHFSVLKNDANMRNREIETETGHDDDYRKVGQLLWKRHKEQSKPVHAACDRHAHKLMNGNLTTGVRTVSQPKQHKGKQGPIAKRPESAQQPSFPFVTSVTRKITFDFLPFVVGELHLDISRDKASTQSHASEIEQAREEELQNMIMEGHEEDRLARDFIKAKITRSSEEDGTILLPWTNQAHHVARRIFADRGCRQGGGGCYSPGACTLAAGYAGMKSGNSESGFEQLLHWERWRRLQERWDRANRNQGWEERRAGNKRLSQSRKYYVNIFWTVTAVGPHADSCSRIVRRTMLKADSHPRLVAEEPHRMSLSPACVPGNGRGACVHEIARIYRVVEVQRDTSTSIRFSCLPVKAGFSLTSKEAIMSGFTRPSRIQRVTRSFTRMTAISATSVVRNEGTSA